MTTEKRNLMMWLTAGTVLMSLLIQVLERGWHIFSNASGQAVMSHSVGYYIGLDCFAVAPVILCLLAVAAPYVERIRPYEVWFLTVALTTSSMSMIAGSGGMVEFHFSIFMVVAIAAYFESILVILVMTLLFAIQHILGLTIAPALVFGQMHYSFVMASLHFIYLLFTAGAVMQQIAVRAKTEQKLRNVADAQQRAARMVADRIRSYATDLAGASEELAASAQEGSLTAQSIATSIQDLAEGTSRELHSVSSMMEASDTLSASIAGIRSGASQAIHQARESVNRAEQGVEDAVRVQQEIASIKATMHDLSTSVTSLGQQSAQIEEITTSIRTIAEETNMLSLNASIEAARAGEYGRGFAVVATEVRKLAEQSSAYADKIREITQNIGASIRQTADATEKGVLAVEKGAATVATTGQTFQAIQTSTQAAATSIGEVAGAVEEAAAATEGFVSQVREVTDVAEAAAAATHDMSASCEEQMAATAEIGQSAGQLATLAESLLNSVSELQV